jgi:hypothetical protein
VTVAIVAAGYLLAMVTGDPSIGAVPLTELIGAGVAPALLGVGLLGLSLLPIAMLTVAAIGFNRRGERRMTGVSAGVALLLVATLLVAVIFARPS